MKAILISLLALAFTSASALETALTLASGPNTITIDPGLGTISLYYVQDGRLNKRPGTANFLTDLNVYRKTIIRMEKETERPMCALEIGSQNNIPMPDQLMQKLAEAERVPRKQDKDAPPFIPLPVRAANTEAEFWGKIWENDAPYDGVISAALGNRYLIVVVPVVRCFLVYEVVGEQIEPRGWRNYGVDLYVPTVYNSTPLPQEIFDQLPKDVKEEHGEALKAQLEAMSTDAAKIIDVKESEVWVTAGGAGPASDRWVLVDIANTRVLSYHFPAKGIELRSVRNMEVDLMIPSSYNSTPDQRQLFQEFTRDKARKAFVESLGIVQFDLAELRAIVGQRQVKAQKNVSPVQAAVAPNSSTLDIVIDFTQKQKILTYRAVGQGNGLEFMAMRDYTLDSALAALDNMRMEKAYARALLDSAKTSLNNHRIDLAWLTAKTALKMDPSLYTNVEKNTDMHKQFAKLPDYAQVIQAATEAAKKEQERAAARAAKAKEEREKKIPGLFAAVWLAWLNRSTGPLRVEPLERRSGEPVVDEELELARKYAPWIYHEVHPTLGRQDIPAPIDFDGNRNGDDNWETFAHCELVPTVYYASLETATHSFLTYHVFHPRDWESFDLGLHMTHEGDGENLQVVVEKESGRVLWLFTQAHYRGALHGDSSLEGSSRWRGRLELTDDAGAIGADEGTHPLVFIEAKGHGIHGIRDGNARVDFAAHGIEFLGHGIVLRPARSGEHVAEPPINARNPVPYQLESTTAKLWPGVRDGADVGAGRLFDGNIRYEDAHVSIDLPKFHRGDRFSGPLGSSRGISPFAVDIGWRAGELGALFFDPASRYADTLSVPEPWSLAYVDHPFTTH